MRHMLPLLLLYFTANTLFAQKPVPGPEWCAERHQHAPPTPPAADLRSDSVDLLLTDITLDIRQAPTLSATADIYLKTLLDGVASLTFDLQGFNVSAATWNGTSIATQKIGNQVRLILPAPLPAGTEGTVQLVYSGQSFLDATGWGGMYNTGGYTFNLGVGFDADPHSLGRAWFPCFDNFVERCAFKIKIISPAAKPAWCNGTLLQDETWPDGSRARTWQLDENIPSYLASFAAGPYVAWQRVVDGIPVEIAATAADTNKVRNTFQHLPEALACYQYWYGPYKWPRIGYTLVPFNSGAMEHATNIAIMRSAIDGSLGFETLWAHELSHHWWGDLATCSTAEDMWLNEGWASFSEHLFTEWTYGKPAYRKAVRDNFLDVLQTAHINEGGYRAVSGLPHNLTYGKHVYNKGAVVAHNLRSYLGDSLFRQGMRVAMEQTSFSDWSSAEFRDKLIAATGQTALLNAFFKDWVFSPGFSHFSVDSFRVTPVSGGFDCAVFVRQKLRGATQLHQQVPLTLAFAKPDHSMSFQRAVANGEHSELHFTLSEIPRFVWVNVNQELNIARADWQGTLKNTGAVNCAPAKMDLTVTTLPDSAFMRVEYHFVAPDDDAISNPLNYRLTKRYWSIEGDLPVGFKGDFRISYDGRGGSDLLDSELFALTGPLEDSIRLLYRPAAGYPWQEYPNYQKNTLGAANNKHGMLLASTFLPGQYTIGKGAVAVSAKAPLPNLLFAKITPNPAQNLARVEAGTPFSEIRVFDAAGKQVVYRNFSETQRYELDVARLEAGLYRVVLRGAQATGSAALSIVR
ncbi:MAG: T9SS type A sorting domain-containing protein [Chitinophagales bacterium]|nr:T9SS type A sorting domain-containing protein [Chitinophagales bacterium]